ncbi:hypothetical protein [Haliangium ochraceum]|uniref:Uncharacterized protein n=1 Tax=Haliangium ochraceum (strain DSM 14365 / JCM 11303 / SMP-2) TaxID=502025 RepID=D0LNV0_HALO1|nr:hypothetical protein [Haliangium ochraceum]ACY18776.1 hypothetical protein Hoch_6305 [Haliangium ochraceum DSM 14365]
MNGAVPAGSLVLQTGALGPGKSVTKHFQFQITKLTPHAPALPSDVYVKLNAMPTYEIKHDKADGYQSTSSAEASSDVSYPGWAADWRSEAPTPNTAGDEDPVIAVKHSYWGKIGEPVNGGGYAVGEITITNKAAVPLTDLQLGFELDSPAGMYHQAVVVDDNQRPVSETNFDLGSIAAGQSVTHKYWWDAAPIVNSPQSETFDVVFQIMPWYNVIYNQSDAFSGKAGVS